MEQLIYLLNRNVNDDGPDALEGAVSMVQRGAHGITRVMSAGRRQMTSTVEAFGSLPNWNLFA